MFKDQDDTFKRFFHLYIQYLNIIGFGSEIAPFIPAL